jgi:antitoxin (DNA-binding transcriptional repressor) of toxin-antitoxin stability system
MKTTVSIREVCTNFRSVKRKIEASGEAVITDNGVPRFLLKSLPPPPVERHPLPDYQRRLLEPQPQPLSAKKTRRLHEENRDH